VFVDFMAAQFRGVPAIGAMEIATFFGGAVRRSWQTHMAQHPPHLRFWGRTIGELFTSFMSMRPFADLSTPNFLSPCHHLQKTLKAERFRSLWFDNCVSRGTGALPRERFCLLARTGPEACTSRRLGVCIIAGAAQRSSKPEIIDDNVAQTICR
jgi:hypothetical protein